MDIEIYQSILKYHVCKLGLFTRQRVSLNFVVERLYFLAKIGSLCAVGETWHGFGFAWTKYFALFFFLCYHLLTLLHRRTNDFERKIRCFEPFFAKISTARKVVFQLSLLILILYNRTEIYELLVSKGAEIRNIDLSKLYNLADVQYEIDRLRPYAGLGSRILFEEMQLHFCLTYKERHSALPLPPHEETPLNAAEVSGEDLLSVGKVNNWNRKYNY